MIKLMQCSRFSDCQASIEHLPELPVCRELSTSLSLKLKCMYMLASCPLINQAILGLNMLRTFWLTGNLLGFIRFKKLKWMSRNRWSRKRSLSHLEVGNGCHLGLDSFAILPSEQTTIIWKRS